MVVKILTMRFYLSYLLVFLLFGPATLHAQERMAIGQWQTHLPFSKVISLTQSEDYVYMATEWAVMYVNKEDMHVDFLTKTDGLSEAGMGVIGYNHYNDALVLTYSNSEIDLIKNGQIINLSDIKNSNNIVGDRSIRHIYFDEEAAYLATDFGLISLNTDKAQFDFTTFTGNNGVNATQVVDGFIYIATDDGIYRLEKNHPNPVDFGVWEKLTTAYGLPDTYFSNAIASFDGKLYADVNDAVYELSPGNSAELFSLDNFSINYINSDGPYLNVGFFNEEFIWSGKVFFLRDGEFVEAGYNCVKNPLDGLINETGRVWFADLARGLRYTSDIEYGCSFIELNRPFSHNTFDIAVENDELWIASGGISNDNPLLRWDGVFSRIDGEWNVINSNNTDELSLVPDFSCVALHPFNDKVYMGSFYEGLVEYDGENFVLYDNTNSSLNNVTGDDNRTRISDVAFDRNQNLWISNHLAAEPISVLKEDGTWKSFSLPCTSNRNLLQMVVDANGYKWFVAGSVSGGLLVFDEGDLDNDFDDRCRFFNKSNSALPSTKVNCLAVDLDGDVWVGTNEGVVVFDCGASAFEDICQGSRRTVEQNGFFNYLLVSEDVKAIAVDGANRKWFGTTNGIFVQSPNGEKQVARFTEDNSPLLDNTIIDITIHPESGEVFIGTNKGLISYRGEATEGDNFHESDVYAFPNPVRPDYEGPIAIKGLARDSDIKITDINGRLIYEGKALGGQAIWNGRDYNGRRANSGVYLVYSTSTSSLNEPDAIVTKILFLR